MAEFATKAVGNTALGLSIGAIAAEALSGTFNGLLGGTRNGGGLLGGLGLHGGGDINPWLAASLLSGAGGGCSDDHCVNRYEAGQSAKIAELESEIKLRDSNIYTDSKLLELYKYFDGELKDVRGVLGAQAVMNQKTADSFEMVRNDMICCKNELYSAIARERDERCCGDNAIITYVNGTFYPKMVADVTVGTETTAQLLYNPLPNCGCGCK